MLNLQFSALLISRAFTIAVYFAVVPFAVIVVSGQFVVTPAVVALAVGVLTIGGRMLALPAGRMIDKFGARFVVASLLIAITLTSCLQLIIAPRMVLILVIIMLAIAAPIFNIGFRVLVTQTIAAGQLSLAFGWLGSFVNLGIIVGSGSAGLLLAYLDQIQILLLVPILALAALSLLPFMAKERAAESAVTKAIGLNKPNRSETAVLSRQQFRGVMLNTIVVSAHIQILIIALADYAYRKFGVTGYAATFFSIQAAMVIVVFPLFGFFTQQLSTMQRLKIYHLGSVLVPISLLAFAVFPAAYPFLAIVMLAVVITIGEALSMPSLDVLITNSSKTTKLGRAFGKLITVQTIGMGVGTILSAALTYDTLVGLNSSVILSIYAAVGTVIAIAIAATARMNVNSANHG
jgi:MFS family permease